MYTLKQYIELAAEKISLKFTRTKLTEEHPKTDL